jgi:hypothetical protein
LSPNKQNLILFDGNAGYHYTIHNSMLHFTGKKFNSVSKVRTNISFVTNTSHIEWRGNIVTVWNYMHRTITVYNLPIQLCQVQHYLVCSNNTLYVWDNYSIYHTTITGNILGVVPINNGIIQVYIIHDDTKLLILSKKNKYSNDYSGYVMERSPCIYSISMYDTISKKLITENTDLITNSCLLRDNTLLVKTEMYNDCKAPCRERFTLWRVNNNSLIFQPFGLGTEWEEMFNYLGQLGNGDLVFYNKLERSDIERSRIWKKEYDLILANKNRVRIITLQGEDNYDEKLTNYSLFARYIIHDNFVFIYDKNHITMLQ